ncbi:hypothetical protein [Amphibacillus cookii]|uniref:hypothetical protein n=1 Tax=Amphibacillus cookii TaxID=767787 RepID=UPI00195D8E6F|nr:hypothetical protein [Amphibacillus cookii]MBM7541786.1 hypothetical protein [Amphibacillus cookii]
MIIKWEKNYFLYLLLIIVFLIATGYYGNRLLLSEDRQSLTDSEEVLATQQRLLDQLLKADKAEEDWLDEAEKLRSQLPTEQNVDQLIDSVFELEERLDVTITRITKSTEPIILEQDDYPHQINIIDYQLSFETVSLEGFNTFIRELNDMERFVELIQLEYQQPFDDQVSSNVTIRAFYNENVLIY